MPPHRLRLARAGALLALAAMVSISFFLTPARALAGEVERWSAGTARARITPWRSMAAAGLPERGGPSDGKLSELWLKVLAVRGVGGQPAVVVSMDLYGVSRSVCDHVRERLLEDHRLPPDNILIVTSRTLSGPLTRGILPDLQPADEREKERVEEYTDALENTIVAMVGEALASMRPATLWRGEGYLAPSQDRTLGTSAEGPGWRPPPALPVVVVRGLDERIVALLFSSSLRGSNLTMPQWFGDLSGQAQARIESLHPGMLAIPVGACAADVAFAGRPGRPASPPEPPPTLDDVDRLSRDIAMTVRDVLQGPMRPVRGVIATASVPIAIPYETLPPRSILEGWSQGEGWRARWAARALALGEEEGWRPPPYTAAIRAWRLGDLVWIQFPGDAAHSYAKEIRERLGHETWVTAQADECLGTLPLPASLRARDADGASRLEDLGLHGHVGESWASGAEAALVGKAIGLGQTLGATAHR